MAQPAQLPDLELAQSIERDAELPIGLQLLWRLRWLIQSGRLAGGERLPGVRDLASQCQVNVNTARNSYAQLEREGLITSHQGSGTFVSEDAPASDELATLTATAIADAYRAGIDPVELATAIYAAAGARGPRPGTEPPSLAPGGGEHAARAELRRQIERLEAQLAAYPGVDSEAPAPHPSRAPVPHVADLRELERTRDRLLEQLRAQGQTAEQRGRRAQAARQRLERMAAEPKEHKWEWVSSEDLGEPGCKTWDVAPRFGPAGAAMGWWRIRVSGGCPLAGAA